VCKVLQATDPQHNSAPEGINCTPVASQKSKEQESNHFSSTVMSPGCFGGPEHHRVKVLRYCLCGEKNTYNKQAGPSSALPETEAAKSKHQESGS